MTPLPPLVLASASPRRSALLAQAGLDFIVAPSHAPEDFPADMPLEQVPVLLAARKAQAAQAAGSAVVIAADSVVILDNAILNKPESEAEAAAMLGRLSGRRHSVVTGVALRQGARLHTFAERTEVFFRELDAEEIAAYVATGAPLDKAGAYGIQDGLGLTGVRRIEGDYYNVMGLPVCRLLLELGAFVAGSIAPAAGGGLGPGSPG